MPFARRVQTAGPCWSSPRPLASQLFPTPRLSACSHPASSRFLMGPQQQEGLRRKGHSRVGPQALGGPRRAQRIPASREV